MLNRIYIWYPANKALIKAVETGTLDEIKQAVSDGGDLHFQFKQYSSYTLMHVAAGRNYSSIQEALDILGFLKEQGLDINARYICTETETKIDDTQQTPLLMAARKIMQPHYPCYAFYALLELGADINQGYGPVNGMSVLHVLVDNYVPVEIIEKALAAGANPLRKDGQGFLPHNEKLQSWESSVKIYELIKRTQINARKAGMQECAYDFDNRVPVPDVEVWNEPTKKLLSFLINALTSEKEQFYWQGSRRVIYAGYGEDYPCSLAINLSELNEKGIHMDSFGRSSAEQRRNIRLIMRQVIALLMDVTVDKISGGTDYYDVRLKTALTDPYTRLPDDADVVFDITNRFVKDIRQRCDLETSESESASDQIRQTFGFAAAGLLGLTRGGGIFAHRSPPASSKQVNKFETENPQYTQYEVPRF